jgi:hypothetical protein
MSHIQRDRSARERTSGVWMTGGGAYSPRRSRSTQNLGVGIKAREHMPCETSGSVISMAVISELRNAGGPP